ncbi:MAG: GH32 C-terminal domain-containing protein [Akkermansiaceae bacterium]|nr:GH32 C-terminal domain-containing protein [Akkermansiaceae bacterium]
MKIYKTLLAFTLIASVCSAQAAATDKTLVSWVTLNDKAIEDGSILTLQNGSEFDGIIWAEKVTGKWMAGSDFWKRTQQDQSQTAIETADQNTQVQMAIVYEGNEIRIFRNGELYSQYPANNIDLLSSPNSDAVFGLRHIGGGGSIDGAIDDARIYGKALTAVEIMALEPNEPSTINPVAWWDFEGTTIVDRVGRFDLHTLGGGAKLEGGKLVLQNGSSLLAQSAETPVWPANPPETWLTYHLTHPGPGNASPGDPNPAFFWKGRYHLHYIYKNLTGFVFAHVSSADMVHWKWHPTILGPATMGHGMFSGTGFITMDGRAAMVYCGQGTNRNWISYALDDDLDQWSPPEVMLPSAEDVEANYFDPDIWIMDGTYYGVNARSWAEPPSIMKSDNLTDWDYIGELLHPDFDENLLGVGRDEDIACPNMFKLGNKWVLLCISHRLGCRYFIGDFIDEKFLPEQHGMMNWAVWDFFAPESLLTPDGRRVMWSWCTPKEIKWTNVTPRTKNFDALMAGQIQTGIQSLPRELSLPEDGVLRIKPLRELESLRTNPRQEQNITVESSAEYVPNTIAGDTIELELVIEAPTAAEFGIKVLCAEDGSGGFTISSGNASTTLNVGYIQPPFELAEGEDLTLRIFIDKNLIEVFANDRQAAVAWHEYGPNDLRISLFSKAAT